MKTTPCYEKTLEVIRDLFNYIKDNNDTVDEKISMLGQGVIKIQSLDSYFVHNSSLPCKSPYQDFVPTTGFERVCPNPKKAYPAMLHR